MNITEINGGVLIENAANFDPFISCECGQCFRFTKISDTEYDLIANGRALDIKKSENGYFFADITLKEFDSVWHGYFDLSRDYGKIIDSFTDKTLIKAASVGGGIRIFRQDPWETLISFIISQNNNIPRIKKIIELLCVNFGEKRGNIYLFPDAKTLYEAGVEGLSVIRAGFRAKYIFDAAEKTLNGEISPKKIKDLPYADALSELKKIKGVGDKVANCVLLFGYGFTEAFPRDVWVKRVIEKYYGEGFDEKTFGEYAGIAQQYLFNYERNNGGDKV